MSETPTPVWDGPTRVFHWALVLLLIVAWVTAGEQMAIHRGAGYAILGLLAFRIWWGLAGGSTARFRNFVRGPGAIRRYLSATRNGTEGEHAGHNPLGGLSVLGLLGLVGLQVVLGLFAIDEDGFEGGPLSDRIDFDLAQQFAEWHELSFRLLQGLVVLHLAAILYYAVRRRQDLVRPMITGARRFKGPVQGLVRAPIWRLVVGVLIALAVGFAASRGFRLG
jgi:cytochrome b